eukprot:TRINITY_DN1991_c0_g1_i1.p1 TRINITY_DN1991_c0_g1~~TRINITY_DN1991_c0_g1_i1.p1  ORF type:complete len:500 (+),score=74.41 TRINITY_DN1991_c0_g1_i1:82-1581(+)
MSQRMPVKGSNRLGTPPLHSSLHLLLKPAAKNKRTFERNYSQIKCNLFNDDNIKKLGRGILGVGLSSGMMLLSCVAPINAQEAQSTIRFPASPDPEIFTTQRTLVEAWGIVQEEFVDEHFNGLDWNTQLASSMSGVLKADNQQDAFSNISTMLEKLGDPYTRIVSREDYADFRVNSDGELQGVGLLIATDTSNGKLVVLAPIKGSPADRAGVATGDEVVSIDGMSTEGWDGERAAQSLRGQGGTSVRVKFARRSDQIPGVPGVPEKPPTLSYKEYNLKREKVVLSSVSSTIIEDNNHKLGYIKLSSFTNNSASDVRQAILNCEKQGADSYILDLRNNPGGLVKSSMEIARLFMDGHPTVFNVSGREGYPSQAVGLQEGKALLGDKMVVLVNKNSASASEILAGSLQDNGRATIVGDTTFGKGKIQSVFELADGSALFVTVAKYQTPQFHDIDMVGVHPDSACLPRPYDFEVSDDDEIFSSNRLINDDCFSTAETLLADS